MKQQLVDLRELIQDDLLTYLDEMPDRIKTDVCQIVVNRFKPLLGETDAQVQG